MTAPWRVYVPEWQVAYTSRAKGGDGFDECIDYSMQHYHGRVRAEDEAFAPASEGSPDSWEWTLQLRLPNRRGEFRDHSDAEALAAELGPEASIVARFSPEEKRLLAYGTRLLHDQG